MNSQIPIIALTADVTTVDLEKCRAAGMNDYISKPVDERLLYSKIVDLFKKKVLVNDTRSDKGKENTTSQPMGRSKCVDLTFLYKRTKTNPEMMLSMISIYLEQTPALLNMIDQGLKEKNWDAIYSAVHKMIPSFSIMGMNIEFEEMAKKIQEYARTRQHLDVIEGLIGKIDAICKQACLELKEEYRIIEKNRI
jgi:CheY-like chemotaxis protein